MQPEEFYASEYGYEMCTHDGATYMGAAAYDHDDMGW